MRLDSRRRPRLGVLVLLASLPCIGWTQALLTATDESNRVLIADDPLNATAWNDGDAVSGLPADARPHGACWVDDRQLMVADFNHSRVFLIDAPTRSVVRTIGTLSTRFNGSGSLAASPDGSVVLGFGQRDTMFNEQILVLRAPFDGAPEYLRPINGADALAAPQSQGIVFAADGRAFVHGIGSIHVIDPPYSAVGFKLLHVNVAVTRSGALALSPDGQVLLASNGVDRIDGYRAPFYADQQPDFAFNMTWQTATNNLGGMAFLPDGRLLLAANNAAAIAVIEDIAGATPAVQEFILPSTLTASCGDSGDQACRGFEHIAVDATGMLALLTGNSGLDFAHAPLARLLIGSNSLVVEAVAVDSSDPMLRGRGAGAAAFRPAPRSTRGDRVFLHGFED